MFTPFQQSQTSDFGQAILAATIASRMPQVSADQRLIHELHEQDMLKLPLGTPKSFFESHISSEMQYANTVPGWNPCSCIMARTDPSLSLCHAGARAQARDDAMQAPYAK